MSISSSQKAKLNKMNKAAQLVSLGDLLAARESHTVTASEGAASAVVIDTGLDSITGFIVQGYDSGSALVQTNLKVTTSDSDMTISGSTIAYEGCIINWIAY